jgi:hypothetical protein
MTPLARWADDELRSTNAQIEFLLRHALADAGRLPGMRDGGAPAGGRVPAARPKPPGRRGAMTGSGDTDAAWLEQAPPTTADSPELPVLRDIGDHLRCLPERTERRILVVSRRAGLITQCSKSAIQPFPRRFRAADDILAAWL